MQGLERGGMKSEKFSEEGKAMRQVETRTSHTFPETKCA